MNLQKKTFIFINEKEVSPATRIFLNRFFIDKGSTCFGNRYSYKKKNKIYRQHCFLVITLKIEDQGHIEPMYALIELPKQLDRFVVLPKKMENNM